MTKAKIVEALSEMDSKDLIQLAVLLVNRDHNKADSLAFVLDIELRNHLVAHGFSEKVNTIA